MFSDPKQVTIEAMQDFFRNKIPSALIILDYKDDCISFPYHWTGLEIIDDDNYLHLGELDNEPRDFDIKKCKIESIIYIEGAFQINMKEGRQLVITYESDIEFEE